MPKKVKILKSTVQSIPYSGIGQVIYWDTTLSGFGVRVGTTRKTYIVQKKINGKDIKVSLGAHGQITAEQARKMAINALSDMTNGINPTDKKKEAKAKGVTLHEAFEAFLSARKTLKPRTVSDYKYTIKTYFPDWKHKALVSITKDNVARRHKKIGGSKSGEAQANLVMRYLRAIFNFAMGQYTDSTGNGIILINPVSVLSQTRAWYKVQRKQTYIKSHEIKPLFDALEELETISNDVLTKTVTDYLRILLFTGLRKNEAATLKWEQVDFKDKTLSIADTKNNQPLTLPLSNYLCKLLEKRCKAHESEYIFTARQKDKPLMSYRRQWDKIKKISGLSFSPHDLRRTFITIADSLDISSYAIKRLVNHTTSGDVTAGYIIHDVERLRKPMQQITNKILFLAKPTGKNKVVNIHR